MSTAFSPGIVTANDLGWGNPVGLGFLDSLAGIVHSLYIATVLVGAIVGTASLVIRYRRGSSDARHQVKWFAAAFGFVALTIAAYAIATGPVSARAPGWLMEDRLDALGGSLTVTSLLGDGTTLAGAIPAHQLAAA